MKPCKACKKQYGEYLCLNFGHCVFEGTNEWPKSDQDDHVEVSCIQPKF